METTKPTDNRIFSFLTLYDMQSSFFANAIDSITDADAHKRLDTPANHVAWLTGSLVQQRFEIAGQLTGKETPSVTDDLFKNNKGIQTDAKYPAMQKYKEDWQKITPILREALINATPEELDKKIKFPGMEFSVYELVGFFIYREANIIGQIALWRRLLGYEPMKYM
jgi:hypothetical protein